MKGAKYLISFFVEFLFTVCIIWLDEMLAATSSGPVIVDWKLIWGNTLSIGH